MRSRYSFLIYGGLGAVIMSVFRYIPTDILKPWFPTTAAGTGPNAISPAGCLILIVGFGIPTLMGLLAARSTGFASHGGAAGATSFVGYGLAMALLDPVLLHFPAAQWSALDVALLGCQSIVGFVCGVLGGLVGRGLYEPPAAPEPLYGAPSPYWSHESFRPGGYGGLPVSPGEPYGTPPGYRASGGLTPYSPPQHQPPPMYQPAAAPQPAAYPAPWPDPSPDGSPHYGMPTTADAGVPWNAGWPPSGGDDQHTEDPSEGPWNGWQSRRT